MRLLALRVLYLGLGLSLAACGAAGGPNGGAANLPSRGIAPWEKVEDTPSLTPPAGAIWVNPSALRRGDNLEVYFEVQSSGSSEIVRASADDEGELLGTPTTVLVGASQPAATVGPGDTRWLAWVDPDGTLKIGTIDADDQVEMKPLPVITGTSPVVLFDRDDMLHVFFVEDGRVQVIRQNSLGAFSAPSLVLAPGVGCLDNAGEETACWDADAIVDIDVRLGATAVNRTVFRIFYTGKKGSTHAFGFAASYDGRAWERYAYNPVFSPGNRSRSPTAAISGGRYLLYYSDMASKSLRLGVLEPAAISETW